MTSKKVAKLGFNAKSYVRVGLTEEDII